MLFSTEQTTRLLITQSTRQFEVIIILNYKKAFLWCKESLSSIRKNASLDWKRAFL